MDPDMDKQSKKMSAPAEAECANCAAVGTVLSKCSKCLMVAYCSKTCQLQHWKDGGHKRFCVPPSERTPSKATDHLETCPTLHQARSNCVICDDDLDPSSAGILPCGHRFHGECLKSIRQFSVSQVCPLCRAPLPPEPSKAFDVALREYMEILKKVMTSGASWSALPASDIKTMLEVTQCARAAADQGHPGAQTLLGDLYLRGQGVIQDEAEGLAWYRKAASQGYATAQRKLDTALGALGTHTNDLVNCELKSFSAVTPLLYFLIIYFFSCIFVYLSVFLVYFCFLFFHYPEPHVNICFSSIFLVFVSLRCYTPPPLGYLLLNSQLSPFFPNFPSPLI